MTKSGFSAVEQSVLGQAPRVSSFRLLLMPVSAVIWGGFIVPNLKQGRIKEKLDKATIITYRLRRKRE